MNHKIIWNEDYNDGYYHIAKDVNRYPNAGIFVVYSRRGPGKTYGALASAAFVSHKPVIYIKRTKQDIELLCTKWKSEDGEKDFNPYSPINRDFGVNIQAHMLSKKDGIAAFYETDGDGKPVGSPYGFAFALASVGSIKGFNIEGFEWIIFDEFIPVAGTRVLRSEGKSLLSIYMTLVRDKIKRGETAPKLILLSNCDDISSVITTSLNIIDYIAEMEINHIDTMYVKERSLFIRHISMEEYPMAEEELDSPIAKLMKGTSWYDANFGGSFAYNDFSSICNRSVKHAKPVYRLQYNRQMLYVYYYPETGKYHMCTTRGNGAAYYNLDRENEQKKFYIDVYFILRTAMINDMMTFEKYSMYDLICNYKDFFKL